MADYLKIPELARRLDVSEKTARRYVKAGALPSTFIGGAYRVTEVDLEAFLRGAEVKPEDASPKAAGPPLPEPLLRNRAGHDYLTHSLAEAVAFAEAASQAEIKARIRDLGEEKAVLREAVRHLPEYVPELFRPPLRGKTLPHARDSEEVKAARDAIGVVAGGFAVRVMTLAAIGARKDAAEGGQDLIVEAERILEAERVAAY